MTLTTGTGITRATASLRSGIITLTGETGLGQVSVSSAGQIVGGTGIAIVGSPGVTDLAPVPLLLHLCYSPRGSRGLDLRCDKDVSADLHLGHA